MKKILLFIFIIPFFWSCKETEPTPAESLIANKDWQTQGLFVAGVATEAAPYVKIRFSKSTINSTVINGQNLGPLATWSVAGNVLSLTYPNYSTSGSVTFSSQSVKITKTTETELWVAPLDGSGGISLFGLINLTQDAEFRFTLNPNSVAPNVTDANLTGVTWKGFGSPDAGYFSTGSSTGTPATGLTLKFGTFYGINYVTVGTIPTPATWALNAAKTRLILSYPRLGATAGGNVAFTITGLTATSLKLSAASAINILGGAINLPLNQELRMVPQ
ncbi:MAG: hypothetical protein EAZ85_09940 [Bacteroidetes bacterium]|nr:MAG: hypothetical protein EAZ85_09940 [Bacteroidota bacterium]TAG85979.1 MAG: hypothetical protein EAZ20_13730 [Bacteroidota bacterium]